MTHITVDILIQYIMIIYLYRFTYLNVGRWFVVTFNFTFLSINCRLLILNLFDMA